MEKLKFFVGWQLAAIRLAEEKSFFIQASPDTKEKTFRPNFDKIGQEVSEEMR